MSRAGFRFPESTPAFLILRRTLGRCEQRPSNRQEIIPDLACGFQGALSQAIIPLRGRRFFLRNASEFLRNI
jgi:hypothetical protein